MLCERCGRQIAPADLARTEPCGAFPLCAPCLEAALRAPVVKVRAPKRRRRLPNEIPSLHAAIRSFCAECMGYEGPQAVRQCTAPACWLYPWRNAERPEIWKQAVRSRGGNPEALAKARAACFAKQKTRSNSASDGPRRPRIRPRPKTAQFEAEILSGSGCADDR